MSVEGVARVPRARALWTWLVDTEGSTRTYALLRVGTVCLCWAEWAEAFIGPHGYGADRLLTAMGLQLCGFLTLIGLYTRVASALFALTTLALYYYWGHYKGVEAYIHHHSWLMVALAVFVALAPAGRSYSVDRWRALKRVGTPKEKLEERGPLWPLRLVAFQISAIYFWGAYDKLQPGFVSGVRMQHHFMRFFWGSDYPQWSGFPLLAQGAAIGTILVEFGLAFLLFVPRLQLPCILVALLFHWGLYETLPVGPFTLSVYLGLLAFVDPNVIHRIIDTLGAPVTPSQPNQPSQPKFKR